MVTVPHQQITVNLPSDPDERTLWAVETMRELVDRDLERREIIALAAPLTRAKPNDSARAVYDFVREHFGFHPDPPRIELLRNPAQHAANILNDGYTQADCDESASLVAALLKRAGCDPYLIVIEPWNNPLSEFAHVFAGWMMPCGKVGACDAQEGFFVKWPRYRRAMMLQV